MRELFRSFSQIEGFFGWMIGKISFADGEEIAPVKAYIKKEKKNYAVLAAAEESVWLQIYIVNSHRKSVSGESVLPVSGAGEEKEPKCVSLADKSLLLERTFYSQEILDFVAEVQDDNWIHQTHKPVVPGLFLWEWLWQQGLLVQKGSMLFRSPAYAEEKIMVYIDRQTHHLLGIVGRNTGNVLLWEVS